MRVIWWCFVILLVACLSSQVDCAKIMFVAFISGKSLKIVYEPVLLELAKRGHQVTIVSSIPAPPTKVQNVRQLLTIDMEKMDDVMPNMFEMKESGEQTNPFKMMESFANICKQTYQLPLIKELMSEKFDLIMTQPLFNDCVMGFIAHFNTSLVLITPVSTPPMFSWITGTPAPPSFNPHLFMPYTDKMTFKERFINFGFTMFMSLTQALHYKPTMTALYRDQLQNQNIPSVDQVLSNASLILSNGHFSIGTPKAFFPDIVEVGGMHCRPAQPLPKDLEDFVNSSGPDGFIFFSMGSVIKAHTMPEKYRLIFMNTFAKLKQKVLWKWETEQMPNLPKNVKLSKWLPQQDVLGHPKIKLFITHGGYGGTTEAAYHGAPLLGIPMFGDQSLNMQISESAGFALTLELTELTEEKLLEAINRLLNEKSFYERAKSLSKIFQDQPDKPLDRAIYWTEYVIRHKGAVHMRSAARELNFWQYHSIDILASYSVILFIILYTISVLVKFLLRTLYASGSQSDKAKSLKKKKN